MFVHRTQITHEGLIIVTVHLHHVVLRADLLTIGGQTGMNGFVFTPSAGISGFWLLFLSEINRLLLCIYNLPQGVGMALKRVQGRAQD